MSSTRPAPVKLEFKTTEFPHVPMSPRLREKFQKQTLSRGRKALSPEMKLNLGSARVNAALLAKKAKARRFTRRVEMVRRSKQRKTQALLARMEEKSMESALRRFSARRAQLERLNAQHEKVDRLSLAKIEKDLSSRLEESRRVDKRLEAAAARREALEARKLQFPKRDLLRGQSLRTTQEQGKLEKMTSIECKMQKAEEKRATLLKKRASPRKIDLGSAMEY